jgi:hypothetical protein
MKFTSLDQKRNLLLALSPGLGSWLRHPDELAARREYATDASAVRRELARCGEEPEITRMWALLQEVETGQEWGVVRSALEELLRQAGSLCRKMRVEVLRDDFPFLVEGAERPRKALRAKAQPDQTPVSSLS